MIKITFDEPETKDDDISKLETSENITLSENAAKRINHIIKNKGEENLFLRLSVQGGGCSGYSYNFKLVNEKTESDISITNNKVEKAEVIIDPISFNYLKGSSIDFEESLEASQFVVNNPNATSSCGCGSSFSL